MLSVVSWASFNMASNYISDVVYIYNLRLVEDVATTDFR